MSSYPFTHTRMLTPVSVIPNAAPADDELVVVVTTDERGFTQNVYLRDAALKARYLAHEAKAQTDRAALDATIATARAVIDTVAFAAMDAQIAAAAVVTPLTKEIA